MIARDDDRAARYLLDELSGADRDAFEAEYFFDDHVYSEVLAAEDDLMDSYCEGSLSPDRRRRFEQRYLATAEGLEGVEFARALKRFWAAQPAREAPAIPSPPARQPVRWLAWAAVVVAAVTALAVFVRQQAGGAQRAREEQQSLQGRIARQQERAVEQERRIAELGQELARAQEQARALEEVLGAGTPRAPISASLVLTGGLDRDAAGIPRLALQRDVAVVRLLLHLEGQARATYRASLETPEGDVLWTRDGLRPTRRDGTTTVTLTVPAAVLTSRGYVVTLTGPGQRRGDTDADFAFEVRRAHEP